MSASPIRRLGSLGTVLALTLLAAQAQATTYTWIATTSGTWTTAANWDANGVPASAATTSLVFNDGTYTATNNEAANPFLLNSLTFNDTGTNVVTVAGTNPLDFVLNGATQPTITRGAGSAVISSPILLGAASAPVNLTTFSTGGTLTLTGAVNDNGNGSNIFKTGAGTLVFAGTNGTTTSSFNQLSVQGGAVNVTGGTLDLTQPDPGTRIPGLQIGAASGQVGSFTASGGAQIVVSENVFIGDAAGSTGTLTVTGAGTVLSNTTGAQSGRFAVGQLGNGTLNVLNGGVVNAAFLLTNRSGGTSGTINVDGAGSVLNTIVTGSGGSGNLQIASNGAVGTPDTGTLNVTNGGVVNVGTTLFVGQATGNTGIVNESGIGSLINVPSGNIQLGSAVGGHGFMTVSGGATATTGGTFFIGNGNGTAGVPGDGTLTVTGGGSTITAAGNLQIATTAGAVGTVNILTGGTANIAGSVFVGINGAGTSGFPDAAGTLNINGGVLDATAGFLIVSGGATPGGTGTLNVTNNGLVNVNNFTVTQNDGGTGTATVSDGGKILVASQFEVGGGAAAGVGGTATLNINNGGQVIVGGLSFAGATTVTGTINLNGFQSTLTSLGQVQLGGQGGTPGAPAALNANAGSVVNFGDLILYGSGAVNASGSSFTVNDVRDGVAGTSVGTLTIGTGSTFTINNTDGNFYQYSGAISGAGNLTKSGSGEQILTGSNSYGGTTNINGGILGFGAASNLGLGAITFNGGTLQWLNNGSANTTDITAGPRTVTLNGGGGTFDTNFNSITLASPIGGVGGLRIIGGGTVTLAGTNTYLGTTNIQNGVLVVTADANLGSATGPLGGVNTVSGTTAGTLIFSGTGGITTTRLYNMNGGTIATNTGQVLTLNGSLVTGAVLDGSGTVAAPNYITGANGAAFNHVSTTASVAISSRNANDQFFHFVNNGTITVAQGVNTGGAGTTLNYSDFNNQASGTFNVGGNPTGGTGNSQISVANFQSTGVMNIVPAAITQNFANTTLVTDAGTTDLIFGGGSRTFVGTATTAVFPPGPQAGTPTFVAGIDLHGHNAVVSSGLFVNNGYVEDSTNSFSGPGKVIADFGALVKGAGFFQNTPATQNGGKFQAGNSPGQATAGAFVFGTGGVGNYVIAMDDAAGTAGPQPNSSGQVDGWGLVKAVQQAVGSVTTSGDFSFNASSTSKLSVSLDTLVAPTTVGNDVPGMMENFNPNQPYSWAAVQWAGNYSGPTSTAALDAATGFDLTGFQNPVAGTFGWDLDLGDHTLFLTYSPSAVPEPGTLALLGAAAALGFRRLRRRK